MRFVILFFLISSANCELGDFGMPTYSTAASRAVLDFIGNFYINIASTFNIYCASQPEKQNVNLDMINEILYNVNSKIAYQIDNLDDGKITAKRRSNNILFVDSLKSFMAIYRTMTYDSFKYQGFYLIIVTMHSKDETIYETMMKIFSALWEKHIINSNIIFMPPENINEAILYTFYPYSYHYCEDVVPIQLNQYRYDQWINNIKYFPKKLKNFHGCHLRVATFDNPPFMLINRNKNGIITVDGLEGILLRVLAQRFNFNVDLYNPKELWGSIYPNNTYSGAIKMVVESKVNFTLGFFASMPGRDKIMEPSYVHYTTQLVWIVPPGMPQSAIEKLANPLGPIIWILSSVTFVLGFVVIAVIKNYPKIVQNFVFGNKMQSPGMNLINVVLGNSLHQSPMRNFSRFLLLISIIYFFIIRTCYSSGLVKFMQMDTRGQHMQSTSQLIENNFTFYMNEPALVYISEMPEVLKRTHVLEVSEYNRILSLIMMDPYQKKAFLTSTGHLAYRNLKLFPNFYEYADTALYTLNIVIYMNQGSCLTTPFNEFIIGLKSSGLINKWATGLIDRKYLKKPVNDEIKILSLEQLEGAFQLLVGGLSLGLLAFCVENFRGRQIASRLRRFAIFQRF